MNLHRGNPLARRDLLKLAGNLAGAVSVMALLGVSTGAAAELKETKPNRIDSELVMQINVKLGAQEDMGKGPDGYRINYPIMVAPSWVRACAGSWCPAVPIWPWTVTMA